MVSIQYWSVPVAVLAVMQGALPASAFSLHYTVDSPTDGVTGTLIGGTAQPGFELYGMGYGQQDNYLFVGFSTHLPVGGYADDGAEGGSIAWGDLFFNFSGQSFDQALGAGNLYGVRFDSFNDSGAPQLGLYRVITAKSVTAINSGFASLDAYIATVAALGGTPSMGPIPLDGSYFDQTIVMKNVIDQGQLLSSDVLFIEDFSTQGLPGDFGFGANLPEMGSYTYGFRVDVSALPLGEFIAHVFAECINEGLGFTGQIAMVPGVDSNPPEESQSVPEPMTGVALGVSGVGYWLRRRQGEGVSER